MSQKNLLKRCYYMKTAITKSLFTILIFCLISCGEKKEEQKESFDENTYNGFKTNALNESNSDIEYIEKSNYRHSIIFKKDNSIEVRLNHVLSYYMESTPDKVYKTKLDAINQKILLATSKLTPQDSKQAWEETEKEAIALANKEIVPVSCTLFMKGNNLNPKKAPAIHQSNEKGQFATLDLDILETKSFPYLTSDKIPTDLHEKSCDQKSYLNWLENIDPEEKYTFLKAQFISQWFLFNDDKGFFEHQKATLSFNSMNNKELTLSDTILERKFSK